MLGTTQSAAPRTIVIPRQLEGFFRERLTERFADRDDIRIVVDRRVGERRQPRWVSGPGPLSDRRQSERRDTAVVWSLADMPFASS